MKYAERRARLRSGAVAGSPGSEQELRRRHGALALLSFLRAKGMLTPAHARLLARYLYWKLRLRSRLQSEGPCFIRPGVRLEVGPHARLHLGRWSWLGDGTKVRVHEGEVLIGAKSVLGQECTISAYRHISIGRECIIADRVMLIDFDHGVVDVERPIRKQGIYMRDVHVGNNVWMGYGACVLRGASIGDNSVIGTYAVVTRDLPANAVAAGVPARVIRMRAAPKTLRFDR